MARNSVENRNAMSFREVVSWAWTETPPVNRNRTNLLIHLANLGASNYRRRRLRAAFERMRRFMASSWRLSARRAARLKR